MRELAIVDIYRALRKAGYTRDEAVGRMLLAGLDGELTLKASQTNA